MALALLILPCVVVVASLHTWLDRWSLAGSLAHETARAAAIAPDGASRRDVATRLEGEAESQLQSTARSCPRPDGCFRTLVAGNPARGERLRVEVSVWMPGLVVPPFGELAGFWMSVGHDEIVDPYRSLP